MVLVGISVNRLLIINGLFSGTPAMAEYGSSKKAQEEVCEVGA